MDVPVFVLEAFGATLECQGFLYEILLAILLSNTVAKEFGRTLDDSSDLRVLWWVCFAVVLLIVSVRVKHRAHPDELEVSLELCRHFSLRKVEPLGSGIWLLLSKVLMVSDESQNVAHRDLMIVVDAQSNYE